MKHKIIFAPIVAILLFAFSCKKDQSDPNNAPVIQLLTGINWKVQELTFVQNNMLYHYRRNGANNDYDFSDDVIYFDKNGTGTYNVYGNSTFNITWEFSDDKKTKIHYIIHDYDKGSSKLGVNLDVFWEHIQVTSTTLKYAEIYTNSNGESTMSSAERTH